MQHTKHAAQLVEWYHNVKRPLPWRKDRDPYRIWISEVMLQQTTVVAVIPFYERFMQRFPNLEALASAPLEDVLEHWAGLGYYSRARNLHRAAQELRTRGFPRSFSELIELPGFGPYTARAVSSLAFGESVGVLDGNVIRVLSRLHGLEIEWWKPQGRARLQALADAMARSADAADVNQALMELGATVCTPSSPACLLCPWSRSCAARKGEMVGKLPLKRPRRAREIWQWSPVVIKRRGRILLIDNDYAPFLKGHWILPGSARLLEKPPERFDYRGSVTHHDIFVRIRRADAAAKLDDHGKSKWIPVEKLKKEIPASLIRKAIEKGNSK